VVDVSFLGNIGRARVTWKGRDLLVQTGHINGIVPGARVAVSVVPSVCGWVRA
jgi:iron(III) transport system ATP-binding protein